jgi:hypothetical protein
MITWADHHDECLRPFVIMKRDDEDYHTAVYNWYIQRPESHWKSNMHWISPADEAGHEDYLRFLSAGGFDSVQYWNQIWV